MGAPALSRRVLLWDALFAPPLRGGRVFYWSLGHGAPAFYHAALPGHILAGIQYALGDLDAGL